MTRPAPIRLSLTVAVMTLFGIQAPGAQPSAPNSGRPAFGPATDDLQKLVARLQACWDVPAAVIKSRELVVRLRIYLKPDGSLAVPPAIVNTSQDPLFAIAAQSAVQAVSKCAPFSFLPASSYAIWRVVEVAFDPRQLPDDKPK
ncbi:MAG TPA: TonB C-terminal domain-containing protein [Xanthobacteraceae bacterium]|nr:TonB C-terminal domain-containing protein [Xanthobacteraceae bacterium]